MHRKQGAGKGAKKKGEQDHRERGRMAVKGASEPEEVTLKSAPNKSEDSSPIYLHQLERQVQIMFENGQISGNGDSGPQGGGAGPHGHPLSGGEERQLPAEGGAEPRERQRQPLQVAAGGKQRGLWQWLVRRPGLEEQRPKGQQEGLEGGSASDGGGPLVPRPGGARPLQPPTPGAVRLMARLLLRHSHQMSIHRCESGFMLFLQAQGMLSLVPDLFQVTQVWKKAKAEQPETINLPLRAVLLKHILDVLLTRLEACQKSEASLKEAREMLILDEGSNIPYLEWNAGQKTLQIRKDREPLPFEEAVGIIQELQKLVLLPLVVMRFHSTRKLVKEHKGDVLPMMLQLGHRTPEAQRAWAHMSRLAHSGLFRTCVLSLRGEKMGRNALEIALHKMISEPCAVCNCPTPQTFAIATPAFFLSSGPTISPLTKERGFRTVIFLGRP